MIVAVLGASGVVGRNLLPRLLEAGHRVRAGVRQRGPSTAQDGVEQVEADILDASTLTALVTGCDAVINVASSIPRADGSGGNWHIYDRIRREGTENVIRVCEAHRLRLVAQSIAMLHCSTQANLQDETSPKQASGYRAAALDSERLIREWDGDYRIVRGGALYGPGSTTDEAWFSRYDRGELQAPGDGSDFISPIHVADLAAAFHIALERAPGRSAWIAADDEPMRYSELFNVVAALCGQRRGAPTVGGPAGLPGFRVSNAALRGLGWAPRYASVRSGLVATSERYAV
ncbi:MAG TPA: NAD(P)-dependent oxidoreductase [Polyangiaceae bacterium]|jgi:nucleoside-diphosphate-sugar epimerase